MTEYELVANNLRSLADGLGLFANAIQIGEFVSKLTPRIISWLNTRSAARRREQRNNGLRRLRVNKAAAADMLLDFYSSNPPDAAGSFGTNVIVPTLLDSTGREKRLPLVTLETLLAFEPAVTKGSYHGRLGSTAIRKHTEDEIEIAARDWALFGLTVKDDPIYSLAAVHRFNHYDFALSRYAVYRATYGALEDELHLALGMADNEQWDMIGAAALEGLDRRQRLLPTVESIVRCEDRLTAGGALALVVARDDEKGQDQYWYVVQHRDPKVADEPGSLTVVPKAVHQHRVSPEQETCLSCTVWRELDEELFARPGEEWPPEKGVLRWDWFAERNQFVRELIDEEVDRHLIHTGLVWDLFKGNYHACFLLYIEDPKWFSRARRNMRFNWEYSKEIQPLNLLPGQSLPRLLLSDEWAPEAHFCFLRGLEWLAKNVRDLASLKTLLPTLDPKPFSTLRA